MLHVALGFMWFRAFLKIFAKLSLRHIFVIDVITMVDISNWSFQFPAIISYKYYESEM
jgi:hypothetical protein